MWCLLILQPFHCRAIDSATVPWKNIRFPQTVSSTISPSSKILETQQTKMLNAGKAKNFTTVSEPQWQSRWICKNWNACSLRISMETRHARRWNSTTQSSVLCRGSPGLDFEVGKAISLPPWNFKVCEPKIWTLNGPQCAAFLSECQHRSAQVNLSNTWMLWTRKVIMIAPLAAAAWHATWCHVLNRSFFDLAEKINIA